MRKIQPTATSSTEAMFRALGLKRIADNCICRDFFDAKKNLAPRRLVALIYGRYGASVQEVEDAIHLSCLREAGEAIHYYSASPDQIEQVVSPWKGPCCRVPGQPRSRKPLPSFLP